jgi:hypothetical protein
MTTARLCAPGFTTKTTRTVTEAEKQAVYAEYGVPYPQPLGSVEVDHLIPLTIGGSNSIGNLWLEPATPLPGFHQKDILEVRLHALVCSGQMTLAVAQHKVASDWVTTYRENVTP